jgi:hypothetical protein
VNFTDLPLSCSTSQPPVRVASLYPQDPVSAETRAAAATSAIIATSAETVNFEEQLSAAPSLAGCCQSTVGLPSGTRPDVYRIRTSPNLTTAAASLFFTRRMTVGRSGQCLQQDRRSFATSRVLILECFSNRHSAPGCKYSRLRSESVQKRDWSVRHQVDPHR